MSAAGTNFTVEGRGPSDVIAFPNIYQVWCSIWSLDSTSHQNDVRNKCLLQLFGSNATYVIDHIKASIPTWAASQAASASSASALETIYKLQSNLIIHDKGELHFGKF